MKKVISFLFVLTVWLNGCTPAKVAVTLSPQPPTSTPSPIPPTTTPSPLPPTFTPSPIPSTFTPTTTFTSTPSPSPTPLPGLVVLPVDTLGKSIPWLPLDETKRPGVNFVAFNCLRPPFNSPLVRQAFAHAIDRQVIAEMAKRYKTVNPIPATSLTPAETLGLDLYGVVGAGYDPKKAKELLAEAGYSDPSAFPEVTLTVTSRGDVAPGARYNMANAMVEMWKTSLGVTVKVEVITNNYANRLKTNPPEMYWFGWAADVNDPDNFLREIFNSTSQYNYGKFSNADYDHRVNQAARISNPAERQNLYVQAERILCETEAALIPLYH